jgi:hypothetical protein
MCSLYLDRSEVALPTDSHVLVRSTNNLEDKKTNKETVSRGKAFNFLGENGSFKVCSQERAASNFYFYFTAVQLLL